MEIPWSSTNVDMFSLHVLTSTGFQHSVYFTKIRCNLVKYGIRYLLKSNYYLIDIALYKM